MNSRISENAAVGLVAPDAVAAVVEPFEPSVGDPGGDEFGAGDRTHGIVLAGEEQHRTLDRAEAGGEVEGALFATAPLLEQVVVRDLELAAHAVLGVGRGGAAVQRHAEPEVGRHRFGCGLGPELGRGIACLGPAQPLEDREHQRGVGTCRGGIEDDPPRVLRMVDEVLQGDHAAERHAVDDRFGDPQRVAERDEIRGPLFEVPGGRVAAVAAPLAAVVVVHDLRDVGEARPVRLEPRMIEAGSAVQEDQRRLRAHRGPVGNETGAFDVDEQPAVTNRDAHDGEGSAPDRRLPAPA